MKHVALILALALTACATAGADPELPVDFPVLVGTTGPSTGTPWIVDDAPDVGPTLLSQGYTGAVLELDVEPGFALRRVEVQAWTPRAYRGCTYTVTIGSDAAGWRTFGPVVADLGRTGWATVTIDGADVVHAGELVHVQAVANGTNYRIAGVDAIGLGHAR